MPNEYQITIGTDGQLEYVNKPELAEAFATSGTATLKRASHVTPVNWILRLAFRALRAHTNDDSPWAAFTRAWPCRWQVAIIDGPTFGPFRQRSAAIDAEVRWLNSNRL